MSTIINSDNLFKGPTITLKEILTRREERATLQKKFLHKHKSPLISFTLNIPGNIKTSPLLRSIFFNTISLIEHTLAKNNTPILITHTLTLPTGDEYICVFNDSSTIIKNLMLHIEESHPLGRLFDIDVLDVSAQKLSRKHYRHCLLCNNQAQYCARNQTHSLEELREAIAAIINNS